MAKSESRIPNTQKSKVLTARRGSEVLSVLVAAEEVGRDGVFKAGEGDCLFALGDWR